MNAGADADVRRRLASFSVSLVADALKPHAPDRLVMRGIAARGGLRGPVFGPARTLRFLPARADVKPPAGNLRMNLIDNVRAGEVLVFDASATPGSSAFGDMVAVRALRNRAAGLVVDGAIRDVQAIAELGLPAFSSGISPAPHPAPAMAWEADATIQCGGVLVQPGDWIFGDADGVIVIPATLLGLVLERGEAIQRKEEFSRLLLERGHPLARCFPLPPRLQPHFEHYLATGELPDARAVDED